MTVDSEYYYNDFGGSEQADIDRLLRYAERRIRSMLLVVPETDLQIKAFKDAVCIQAELIGISGGAEAWISSSSGMAQSFTIGSFSVSSSSGQTSSGTSAGISAEAVSILETAGLLERRCMIW